MARAVMNSKKAKDLSHGTSLSPAKTGSIETAALWLLWVILFVSPFFRGLFFAQQQRVAVIFAGAVFWLVCLAVYKQQNKKMFYSPLEYLFLALPAVYMLSSFSAANYGLALDEIMKNVLYFLFFFSAIKLINQKKRIDEFLLVIYMAAMVVSLAGLFIATGLITVQDGFKTSDGGTIASTFQYKNTLASYLAASLFIGFKLWSAQSNKFLKPALAAGNFLLLTVFFCTNSQGGYIVFIIFSIIFWFLIPAEKRLPVITGMALLSMAGLGAGRMFLHGVAGKGFLSAWLWVLAGGVLVYVAQMVLTSLLPRLTRLRNINITFKQLLAAVLALAAAGVVAALYTGIYQALMDKLHMYGAVERLIMYQDSIKMIWQKPVLGWGGGGWSDAYNSIQSYGYTARQTHSYFLQLAIETGLLGLLAALCIWVAFTLAAVRVYRKSLAEQESRMTASALICAVFAIISHAVIDFDLSLSSITLAMLVLMACVVSMDINYGADFKVVKDKKKDRPKTLQFAVATTMAAVVISVAFGLYYSGKLFNLAAEQYRAGRPGSAALAERAQLFNPLSSDISILESKIQYSLGSADRSLYYAQRASRQARYSPERQSDLALALMRAGQGQESVAAARRALELAPLKQVQYDLLASIIINTALDQLEKGDAKAAAGYIKQMLGMPGEINATLGALSPEARNQWREDQTIKVTDKIKLSLGVAEYLRGNISGAASLINAAAANPQLKGDAVVWQALIAQRQGDSPGAQQILQSAQKDNPNIKRQFDGLIKLAVVKVDI